MTITEVGKTHKDRRHNKTLHTRKKIQNNRRTPGVQGLGVKHVKRIQGGQAIRRSRSGGRPRGGNAQKVDGIGCATLEVQC